MSAQVFATIEKLYHVEGHGANLTEIFQVRDRLMTGILSSQITATFETIQASL